MMDAELAALLARHTTIAENNAVVWSWGRHRLHLCLRAYLADELPPEALITSVRCLVLRDGAVLVSRNADDTHLWPGGRREPGEAVYVTLRREVLEETGWTVRDPVLLGFLHFHHETPKPPDYPYPYPDFCQAVYCARADTFTPDTHDPDGYEVASAFYPIEDVRRGFLAGTSHGFLSGQHQFLSGQMRYLDHAIAHMGGYARGGRGRMKPGLHEKGAGVRDAIAFGMNARLFPGDWRPALVEIAFAARAGFGWLQFNDRAAGLEAETLGAAFVDVAAALGVAGIEAALEIMPRVDPATGRTTAGRTPLDMLTANLPAITALPLARVHWHITFLPGYAADPARLADWLVPQLAAAVACAAREGFRFGIEHNEAAYPALSPPAEFAALLDTVPGLGFVWDLNHTAPEQCDAFLALAPRMTLLHLSDTRLPSLNEHRPIRRGTIDFATALKRLIAAGFRGPAILEIGGLPKSGGYGQDTDTALIDSLARLRRCLGQRE